MTLCAEIQTALHDFQACVETQDGFRVSTHCLYPSFDPVSVYVVGYGDGFKVHDGRGAFEAAWSQGRDHGAIKSALAKSASRFHASVQDNMICVDAISRDWLMSAILAVANASSAAAHAAVRTFFAGAEEILINQIQKIISDVVPHKIIAKDYNFIGNSGKIYQFDFAIVKEGRLILLDGVSPHHTSIFSKYVAFADTRRESSNSIDRFAVYDRPLEREDRALLEQVADLVPLQALQQGVRRVIGQTAHRLSL